MIGPVPSGASYRNYTARDLEYVRDLGLVAPEVPSRTTNRLYAEGVPGQRTHTHSSWTCRWFALGISPNMAP